MPSEPDVLYTRDASGQVRFWYCEFHPEDPSRYRSVSGLQASAELYRGGYRSTTGWTQAEPKNVGRSNATTAVEQAALEVEALYRQKLDRKYAKREEDASRHHFFAPMLAQKYTSFDEVRWRRPLPRRVYTQPKLDGIRMVASAEGMTSRQGKPFHLPHLWDQLRAVFEEHPDLVLDGELYNHELRDDFNQIVSLVKRSTRSEAEEELCRRLIQYHVYDLPSHSGDFSARHDALREVFVLDTKAPSVRVVNAVPCSSSSEVDEQYSRALMAGFEGQMVRTDEPYEVGKRSWSLMKRKEFQDEEFPISRVLEGQGNWAGYAKMVEFVLPGDRRLENGERPKAGIKGSKEFTAKLLSDHGHFRSVTVRYFAMTPGGIPRFPIAVDWHEGEKDH